MEHMEDKIRRKLAENLSPSQLEVINQSHLHSGHSGDDGSGESHFHVKVASELLSGLSRVEAQRQIYAILADEMKTGIHALSISIIR